MGKVIKVDDMPFGDKLYLKKDFLGYRIVNPLKNDDGSINWANLLFGGYRNLIILTLLLLIAGFVMWSYNHDISEVKAYYGNISQDPFYACAKESPTPREYYPNSLNFDELKNIG